LLTTEDIVRRGALGAFGATPGGEA
jgi:hypothetical protein